MHYVNIAVLGENFEERVCKKLSNFQESLKRQSTQKKKKMVANFFLHNTSKHDKKQHDHLGGYQYKKEYQL